jgi:hypothetical protein
LWMVEKETGATPRRDGTTSAGAANSTTLELSALPPTYTNAVIQGARFGRHAFDLRAYGPHWYAVGDTLARCLANREDAVSLRRTLADMYGHRQKVAVLPAAWAGSDEMAANRLTNEEKEIYTLAQLAVRACLSMSSTEEEKRGGGLKRRREENDDHQGEGEDAEA